MLNPERVKKILKDHAQLWGNDRAIGKFHEEAGELAQALNKNTKYNTAESHAKVIGEIADVLISVEKLEVIYGSEAVQFAKREKLLDMERKVVNEKFKRFNTKKKLEESMDPKRYEIWKTIADAGQYPLESQVDDVIAAVRKYIDG